MEWAPWLAGLALLLALAALVLATLANRRWARRARAQALPAELLSALDQAHRELAAQVQELRARVEVLGAASDAFGTRVAADADGTRQTLQGIDDRLGMLAEQGRTALRHLAVVRYDAFADVGGRLSYSAAILDDTSSGLVITALSGKSDIRTYIKAVSGGAGEAPLTPEEQQAVAAAGSST